jgi:uncharacterized membrane protein
VRAPSASLRDGLLWFGVCSYAILYFILGLARYEGHRNFVDLGIFAQTIASAFGCFCNTVEGSHWAFHFSPILYVAAIPMHVWRSALTLVAIQAIAGALTAPAIYGIVLRHADRHAARLSALVVLLYPPLAGAIFNDFHENGLAPASVAWLLWAFDGGYAVATIAFAVIVVCVKEDQALFLAIAAACAALAYRHDALRMRLAAALFAAGAVALIAFFVVIQPHAAGQAAVMASRNAWAPTRFYAWTSADVRSFFPTGIVERLGFIVLAFAPLLFVPFRSRAIIIALLPLAEVLMSRMSTTYTIGSHYAGAWAGWVLYAFTVGIAAIWQSSPRRAYRVLYWCAGLCVAEFAVANPLHPGYFLRARTQNDVALDRFIATLPRDISVATQEEAYTHWAATDPNVTVLPETASGEISACYVLTDNAFSNSPRLVESRPLVLRLVAGREYSVAQRSGSITLYKRTADCR